MKKFPPPTGRPGARAWSSPAGRAPGPGRRWIVSLLVAGAIAAALALMRWPRATRPPTSLDSLADMDPAKAYALALRLGTQGHHLESLPYFRRALAGVREDFWEIHLNYAAALDNAALQARRIGGADLPASRASFERAAMLRESLRQLELAERLAPDPRVRAAVRDARGGNLELWGFPWEALEDYREAKRLDPSSSAFRAHAEACAASLESPTR